MLAGEAGIGKTSLLRAWLERARGRSFTAAYVANLPFARAPYAPIAELCRTLARADPRAIPHGEHRRIFARFLDLAPLGNEAEGESWHKRRLFVLVREFLERLSAAASLALVIDDLHWSDPESLELLHYLAPFVGELRMVLAVALRSRDVPEPVAAALTTVERQPSCYRVIVGPLAPTETRQLVYSLLPAGARLSPQTLAAICDRCADSPLFVEDLVRRATSSRGDVGLPLTVEQSVNGRVASLDPQAAALLEIASAIGQRIDVELLTRVAGSAAPGRDLAALRAARDLDLLIDDDGGHLVFRHEFVREAVYARFTAPERRSAHARIAQALRERERPVPAAVLHRHVRGAGDADAATILAEAAGDEAMLNSAFATARQFYDAALADGVLAPDGRARVAEKLGEAHDLLGSHREAADSFRIADAYARDRGDRAHEARIAIRLAVAAGRLSDHAEERRECERALACSNGGGRDAFAAEVLLALHYANRVDADRTQEHLGHAAALIAHADGAFGVRYHVARAALANLHGDVEAWRAATADAVAAAENADDPAMLANVWSYVADFARLFGDVSLARHGFSKAIDAADRYGLTFTAAKTRLVAADMAFTYGDVAEAHRFVREASAFALDGAYARMLVSAVGLPIALAAADSSLCDRLEDAELLNERPERDGLPLAVSFVASHAELYARRGAEQDARKLIDRALPSVRHAAYADTALLTFARYGSPDHARRAARILAETAAANDSIARVHAALVTAIAAAAARSADAPKLVLAARACAADAGTRRLEAFALELAGDTAEAARMYAACGSRGDVLRLEEPRRRSRTQPGNALTRRESEVAELIAEGYSNRAIAERLVLSDRTVEHHVAAIFSKLGFRSRSQLAAFISRERSSP